MAIICSKLWRNLDLGWWWLTFDFLSNFEVIPSILKSTTEVIEGNPVWILNHQYLGFSPLSHVSQMPRHAINQVVDSFKLANPISQFLCLLLQPTHLLNVANDIITWISLVLFTSLDISCSAVLLVLPMSRAKVSRST